MDRDPYPRRPLVTLRNAQQLHLFGAPPAVDAALRSRARPAPVRTIAEVFEELPGLPGVAMRPAPMAELAASAAQPGSGPLDRLPMPPWYGRWPMVVSYGMGVDSTAMLVLLRASGMRPDLILFADTGSERPETYAYLGTMNAWLARAGFPPITVVRKVPGEETGYKTLFEQCIAYEMLPSLAYGGHMHSCSVKWKAEPMNAYVRSTVLAQSALASGGRVVRVIGYDDSKADNDRRGRFEGRGGTEDDGESFYYYPLQVARWAREECIERIAAAGLPVPPKSSCYFCPSSKPWEIIDLVLKHPDLAAKIVQMEMTAGPALNTIDGLWGSGVKGVDGGIPKPGSMTEFMLVWMVDGRAYERAPQPGDAGVAPFEVRLGGAGRLFRHLSVLRTGDEQWTVDERGRAETAAEGRAAALALRQRVEATYGLGSVDRMIAEGQARSAKRARLSRGRVLWARVRERGHWLATTARPRLQPGDDRAPTGSPGRERVKARAAWDRAELALAKDNAELAPLVAEFGTATLAREKEGDGQ